jgi:hypothetical protein
VVRRADGKWSYTPGTLSEGSHSLTITVTDSGNNPSVPSEAFVVIVDTTPPLQPTIDTVTDDVPLILATSTKIRHQRHHPDLVRYGRSGQYGVHPR